MKKLFLSHFSHHSKEIRLLAKELRYRGIVPWIDKEGGFAVADQSEAEARRAIREDCFGMLLYATEDIFARWFVTHIEMDEAKLAKRNDSRFLLFAIPRGMTFLELKEKSLSTYGVDLSANHTIALPDGCDLRIEQSRIASEILRKFLQEIPDSPNGEITIQVSTHEVFPPSVGEVLCVDGREACRLDSEPEEFGRLCTGLCDAKHEITHRFGQPRLRVEGSKHLSAAFALGRVFSQFRMNIRQRIPSTGVEEYWSSDSTYTGRDELKETFNMVHGSQILAVELATGVKNLSPGVDEALATQGKFHRLILRTEGGLEVDNELCRALANQIYKAIDRAVARTGAQEIHLFAAAPQSLLIMLGQRFAGMPKTFVYDWFGTAYGPHRPIPAGVL